MIIDPENLSRREIIEYYIEYDAKKKNIPLPSDIDKWDWNNPNDIDEKLKSNGFKYGVITGYRQWNLVQLSTHDLFNCAIVNSVEEFAGLSQTLGKLVSHHEFYDRRPDRTTDWYKRLEDGEPFHREWAMILRPTVSSEYPAKWYIEDGSGRAICFLRRLIQQKDEKSLAYGYLGKDPDHTSEFMNHHFRELLGL